MTPDEIRTKYKRLRFQKRALQKNLQRFKDEVVMEFDKGAKCERIRRTYGKLKGVERSLGLVICEAQKNRVSIFDGMTEID